VTGQGADARDSARDHRGPVPGQQAEDAQGDSQEAGGVLQAARVPAGRDSEEGFRDEHFALLHRGL